MCVVSFPYFGNSVASVKSIFARWGMLIFSPFSFLLLDHFWSVVGLIAVLVDEEQPDVLASPL